MVRVDGFATWRDAARRLLAAGVPPQQVHWRGDEDDQESLLGEEAPLPEGTAVLRVPRELFPLAEAAACHADRERWSLLYRVVWRITHGERHLLRVASDPDVHRLLGMEKAVRRECHKMKAFVRFRAVAEGSETRYVAWIAPEHPVLERTAPFFAQRFPSMLWSILTPRRAAHWDGERLTFSAGVPRGEAPSPDALEELWRQYYASTFNPARVREKAMLAEMPVRYWRDLPEARLIAPLLREAPSRVRRMIEQAKQEPTGGRGL